MPFSYSGDKCIKEERKNDDRQELLKIEKTDNRPTKKKKNLVKILKIFFFFKNKY